VPGSITIFTTNYVILETCALLHHRVGKHSVAAFCRDFLPAVQIVWVEAELHAQALADYLEAGRHAPSWVDYASFQSIRSIPCQSALAFDRHYADQGIPLRQDRPQT
jgi:predicted nucleic acid-binding protein